MRRAFQLLERPRPEDQAEAERLLRKALRRDKNLPEAHVGLSRISGYLYGLGLEETPERRESALREAEAAVAQAPDDPRALAARALALALSDRLTPALEEARKSATAGPDHPEAHLALCVVHRLRRELDAALESCRRAADLAPDSTRALLGLAETLRERNDFTGAMQMFGQAAELDHESALPQLGGAATLTKRGQNRAASLGFDLVLKSHSFARDRALQGAAAMRVMAEDYEGALELYAGVVLKDNGSLPTLLSLYGKGYALLRLGRPAEAEYFLSTLIERVPHDYDGPARGREILYMAYDDLVRYFSERGRAGKVDTLRREAAGRPAAPTRFARQLAESLPAGAKGGEVADLLARSLLESAPDEDLLEISQSALALARLESRAGARRPRGGKDSAPARAIALASARVMDTSMGVAQYRMARAWALLGEVQRSLECLTRARASGYLPADQAAAESDFALLRGHDEFKALLNP